MHPAQPASSAIASLPGVDSNAAPATAWLPFFSACLRTVRLVVGLWVFAVGVGLMVRARLGLSAWDVLHDALRRMTPLTIGQVVVAVSVVVLVVGIALGIRPGIGTAANALLVGAFLDLTLASGQLDWVSGAPLPLRVAIMLLGIGTIALGSALYIGANLGAGPRDALMLGVASNLHRSVGTARSVIEAAVLMLGAVLGGRAGIGTVAFVLLIGPAVNLAFRALRMEERP